MVVAYRGATVLEGTGAPARTGTTVVVDGERIRFVGADGDVPTDLLADAEVVDLAGRHLIPGLIDSHQHLATPPDRALAEAVLRRDLLGGVTAVRDMADDLRQVADLARAALVGEIVAPDICYAALMAGPGFFDDPRTWQVSQGATPGEVPWMQAITPATDLPLAVAMARGTFASAIKVYADLPGQTVAAIVAEAKRQGIAVWAHAAVFPASPGEVIAAGVDTVSHVQLMVHEAAGRPLTTYRDKPPIDHARFEGGDDPVMGALFAQMRERGIVLDATASLWGRIAEELRTGEELRTDEELRTADDKLGDEEAGVAGAAQAAEAADARERAAANDRVSAALTGQAWRTGVTVSAGTDRDPDPEEPWPPLFDELDFLVDRCGLTPAEALRCASWGGAVSMAAADRLGTVEVGKQADFVILADDPVAHLSALRSVVAVVKRGRRFDRAGGATAAARSAGAGE
ncbi:imidazolonepropionase-like amidohydrolase [Catenulispora sp. EB89]|uniref:amidohydrolase family protein n=1 Tax=Catenulispora sp. EB89 TaxID=3156257 RepID=UPI0035170467